MRIVVVNPTEIYSILEDEKAYDLKQLVPEQEDSSVFVHILSCGNTKIWAVTMVEGKSFEAEKLNSNMVYMCLEGEVKITYQDKERILHENRCFYGLKDNGIHLQAGASPTRLLIMKDIL